MGREPIAKRDDRTDFQVYQGNEPGTGLPLYRTLVGTVLDVIRGPVWYGIQMEHQYIIVSNNQRYRVDESNVSTPYGPDDDILDIAA